MVTTGHENQAQQNFFTPKFSHQYFPIYMYGSENILWLALLFMYVCVLYEMLYMYVLKLTVNPLVEAPQNNHQSWMALY